MYCIESVIRSFSFDKGGTLSLQDDNMGLVKLVVDSQTKRNVLRLTQTYLTLGLPDIASAVGLPSAAAAELAILRC